MERPKNSGVSITENEDGSKTASMYHHDWEALLVYVTKLEQQLENNEDEDEDCNGISDAHALYISKRRKLNF